MKKLLLLFLAATLVSCSNDSDSVGGGVEILNYNLTTTYNNTNNDYIYNVDVVVRNNSSSTKTGTIVINLNNLDTDVQGFCTIDDITLAPNETKTVSDNTFRYDHKNGQVSEVRFNEN